MEFLGHPIEQIITGGGIIFLLGSGLVWNNKDKNRQIDGILVDKQTIIDELREERAYNRKMGEEIIAFTVRAESTMAHLIKVIEVIRG